MLSPIANAYADSAGKRAMQEAELDACRAALGERHPVTLMAMNNLAVTLSEEGSLQQALSLQEKVVKWCRKRLGESHPNSLAAMVNLSITCCALGDVVQARALSEIVLEIRQRNWGDDHPETRSAMGNLAALINNQAVALRNAGYLEDAEPLQLEAMALMIQVYGADSLDAATTYSATGALLKLQGELEKAQSYFSKALEIRERELGVNSDLTQVVRARLHAMLH